MLRSRQQTTAGKSLVPRRLYNISTGQFRDAFWGVLCQCWCLHCPELAVSEMEAFQVPKVQWRSEKSSVGAYTTCASGIPTILFSNWSVLLKDIVLFLCTSNQWNLICIQPLLSKWIRTLQYSLSIAFISEILSNHGANWGFVLEDKGR